MATNPDPRPVAAAGRTDESLLRRLGDGETEAADALYRRYEARLRAMVARRLSRSLAPRLDADDVVQSVFRRFFAAARDGRYALPGGVELWGLLVAIALNRVRTVERFHRSGKRDVRQTAGLDAADTPCSEDSLAVAVEDALARLPDHHREVTRLRLDGYEVGEIADRLGRSKRTVERVLQETRRRLRTLLDTETADDPAPD